MKALKKLIGFTLICFFSISAYGQNGHAIDAKAAGFSEEGLERYESFLQSEIEAKKLPGAVSLISRKGALAHSASLGHSNMAEGTPMSMDQIFYIQSMTKPVVSIAFMTLFEEGHFFLTDPVSKYIPAFDSLKVVQPKKDADGNIVGVEYVPLDEPVEIWHLLSHTAGFSHGLGANEYDVNLRKLLYEQPHKSINDRVNALLSYPLMGQPGNQWNYSASPDVLCLLIEQFSGKSTSQFLQERIFDPLGMKNTGYNVSEANISKVVGLHTPGPDGKLISVDAWSPPTGNTVYGGTHGLYSTAEDYLKFGLMLLNEGKGNGHRIIGRKTLELMTENHIDGLPFAPGNGFGLGFGIRTDISDSKISGSEGIFHWSGAFNTYFYVDPKEDLVAVLMTQHWPYTNYYASKLRQLVYSAIDD